MLLELKPKSNQNTNFVDEICVLIFIRFLCLPITLGHIKEHIISHRHPKIPLDHKLNPSSLFPTKKNTEKHILKLIKLSNFLHFFFRYFNREKKRIKNVIKRN